MAPELPHSSRRRLLLGLSALGVAAATGCGVQTDPLAGTSRRAGASPSEPAASPTAAPPLVVGAGTFVESTVLAQLYAQALTGQGITARVIGGLGERADYLDAVTDPTIAILPTYTGDLLRHLDPSSAAQNAEEIETALKPAVTEQGRTLLKTSTAVDQEVYCVTAKLSSETGVISLADLPKISTTAVLGGPAELADLAYGVPGLLQVYRAKFKTFTPYTTDAAQLADLLAGKIQVATFSTTQALIPDHGLIQLADPEQMIFPQNVVPLVQPSVAKNSPAVAAINAVQAALTTEDLISLNRKVAAAPDTVATITAAYLSSRNLG